MAALDAGTSATPRISEWRRLHLTAPLSHLAGVMCVDADSSDSRLSHCGAAALMRAMHDGEVRLAVSAALEAHAEQDTAVHTAALELLHTLVGAHACIPCTYRCLSIDIQSVGFNS